MKLNVSCCFCGDRVDEGETHAIDPCAIFLVGHANLPHAEQKEQQFWCHAECFRKAITLDGVMYILEPDFATNGEVEAENEEDADA